MTSFAVAFLASLIGGVLATAIVALIDRYVPVPAQSFLAEPPVYFPRPFRLRAVSFLVVAVWLSLIVFVVCLIVGLSSVRSGALIFGSFGAFVALAFAYLVLAFTLRCPKCQKHVTIQWGSEPPYGERVLGMDGWASVIAQVVLQRRFRCMYCGQQFLVARSIGESVA